MVNAGDNSPIMAQYRALLTNMDQVVRRFQRAEMAQPAMRTAL
jgi:hypothetical protein